MLVFYQMVTDAYVQFTGLQKFMCTVHMVMDADVHITWLHMLMYGSYGYRCSCTVHMVTDADE